ncbi:MAG: SH3 domain-containing protein [Lachnospiraceae bacterium]|nr:SH3 domain-containing protein [Lachnospiraceae bacterium]
MRRNRLLWRAFATAMIITLVIQLCPYTAANAVVNITASGVVTAGELYMRTGPGTDHENVKLDGSKVVLKYGQEVTILGEKNGWYHLRAVVDGEAVEGYSLSGKDSVNYITVTEGEIFDETQILGKITAYSLNLRMGPSTEYEKVTVDGEPVVFANEQELTIIGEKNGWYHIKADYNGNKVEGFCLGDYVEITWGAKEDVAEDSGNPIEKNEQDTDNNNTENDNTENNNTDKSDNSDKTDNDKEKSGKDDKKDKENTENSSKDKTGSETEKDGSDKDADKNSNGEFDPTDLSNGVPEGYEITTLSWSAKFNYKGIVVSANGLNLRKSANANAEVLAVLEDGQEVEVIKSTIVTSKNDKGKKVKTRWYRVIANTGGAYTAGYVVSNYITLDCSDDITATTKNTKQVLRKKPTDKAKRLRTSAGKVIKLTKGTQVDILGDVVGTDGVRYFKVMATYKKTEYVGYIPALALATDSNASGYSVQILTKVPEPAIVEEVEATVTPEPTKTPEDGNDTTGTPEDFAGANAHIKGSAGLSVGKEPKGASEKLFTEDKKLILLYSGDPVELLSIVKDENGSDQNWCYIRFYFGGMEYFGYVRSNYVESQDSLTLADTTEKASTSKVDFETKLEQEGFPESYKAALRELHAQYPSWEFKAFHTGLDWDTVIAAETEVGVNLLPNSRSVEWKSLEKGAYSWKTDTFTVFDGSTWVTASKAAVEYYMDPRNFLTYNTIFQFEVLTYNPDYQDYAGVANILKNTAMYENTYTYVDTQGNTREISFADTFLMAAEYTGVSPFHLASRVKQEVTLGTDKMSNSVTGTVEGYEGLYNYYNIGAYHSTEPGGAIRNGLKFAQQGTSNVNVLIPWTDPFKAIMGGAYYIGNNYINKGQDTVYLQKFNVTNGGKYNHQYMANVEAPYSEGIRFYKAYIDPDQIPIVFSIPVYLNMPEEACGIPEKQYNPNNWLKTLKIYNIDGDKLALTPTFDYTIDQEYSLIVDSSTDYLKIKAATVSSLAKIEGDGAVHPNTGLNRITVSVTAENGDVREYMINIIREEAPETTETPENDDGSENAGTSGDEVTSDNTGTTDADGNLGNTDGSGTEGTTGNSEGSETDGTTGNTDGSGTEGTTGNTEGSGAEGTTGNSEGSGAEGTTGNSEGSGAEGMTGNTEGSGAEGTTGNTEGSGAEGTTGNGEGSVTDGTAGNTDGSGTDGITGNIDTSEVDTTSGNTNTSDAGGTTESIE